MGKGREQRAKARAVINHVKEQAAGSFATIATGTVLDSLMMNLGLVRMSGETDEQFRARARMLVR